MPRLFEDHNLGGDYAAANFTFEKFDVNKCNEKLLEAAKKFNPEKNNLYISGPVGSGKTHVATAIVSKFGGRIIRMSALSRFVRRSFNSEDMAEEDLIGLFCRRPFSTTKYYEPPIYALAIDDLGTEKLTEFSESLLFEILDIRLCGGINGLVVTSNLRLNDLVERFGSERIVSRLAGMCSLFDLSGEKDHRLK